MKVPEMTEGLPKGTDKAIEMIICLSRQNF